MKQILIKILCDEGHVADFLRKTATVYERHEKPDMTYEKSVREPIASAVG